MMWTVCLILALSLFAVVSVFAYIRRKSKYRRGRLLTPMHFMVLASVLSAAVLIFPWCYESYGGAIGQASATTIFRTIGLFLADSDMLNLFENLPEMASWVRVGYVVWYSILIVMLPFFSFGFLLSFFKNLSAYRRYFLHYFYDCYVFSELNERSMALAESLHENQPKGRFFVFTDVYEQEEEAYCELIERAKALNAVFFRKDIATINFSFHSKKKELVFFTLGEDQTENSIQAMQLVQRTKRKGHTHLYVLSQQEEAELLMSKAYDLAGDSDIKIRRVNNVRSLVYRTLYEKGYEKIFQSALPAEDGMKEINVLIVGMGRYGTEMAKALPWFCQMDGYRVRIDVFEVAKDAKARFTAMCPELMEFEKRAAIETEDRYTIEIHDGCNVESADFLKMVDELPLTTYAFVSLGDDAKNVAQAMKLRTYFARRNLSPVIQSVVYNTEKSKNLKGLHNYRGQSYDIDYIGDRQSSYSEDVIMYMEVEDLALQRHLKWGDEQDFWKFDYNYRSSIASAIHHEMKIQCGIPGADQAPDERSDADRVALRILEHRRWNAFMRSEGYSYNPVRNVLAKTHHCLVPFWELDEKEQAKDDD